jgi:serine phosphatase RsbU (regulator of sigma subunit)
MAACLNDIGNINAYQNNLTKALGYFLQSLKIKEEIGDKRGIALSNGNIGAIYTELKNYDLAINYYFKSLKARKELGDKKGLAICYDDLGQLNFFKGDYLNAINYYKKSLSNYQAINDKEGISICNGYFAGAYNKLKKFDSAIICGKRSLEIAKEIGALPCEKDANDNLATSYEGIKEYEKAYFHYKQFKLLNDSIFNYDKQKQLTKMEAVYQGEKKQKEIEILEKDKKLKKAEFRRVQFQKFGFIVGFVLMLALVIVIFRNYSRKQKENILLNQQKAEIEEKNEILNQQKEEILAQSEEITTQRDKLFIQQKDVNDSLEYASLIQHTLLSSEDILKCNFPDYFILYKPRDIISGDFYWFKQIKNFLFIVVADCTGHGVPGAFMSVLGISLLNDIVGKRALDPPAEILNELRKRIKKSLHQDKPDVVNQDGMDIAFCCIDIESMEMQYAGANNPLYIIRNTELIEYKADHMPVGVHPHDTNSFTNKIIQLEKGDVFYLFSDGYTSQFGGPEKKKFNSKPFKKLILAMKSQPMPRQKFLFEKALAEWQGNYEQIDDISLIGVRV